jgi:hypothetical protein
MDQPLEVVTGSCAVPDGHLERVDREVGTERVRQLPADDRAGVNVEDERRVHPAGVGLHVVRSATHSRFGAGALKSRSTRSAGRCWRSSACVVTL